MRLHVQSLGALKEPFTGGKPVEGFRRTPGVIGSGDAHQSVDACDVPGQPPHGAVGRSCVIQGPGTE
ncbi:MAG: hypothetical protein FJ244_05675 [Nitrospira sp.]|nr:hypothetical protein [Nitrospira sp.]